MFLIGKFLLDAFLSASLNQLWAMINAQQLIVNQILCNVTLPPDTATFYASIAKISSFDFYDTNEKINEALNLQPTESFTESFKTLGFDSIYALNNIGPMIIFYIVYPFLVLIEISLRRCRNCSSCCYKTHRSIRKSLYYETLLTGIFESYFQIVTCCLIGLYNISFASYGESV